ncbi:MAG: hypothetical protein ABI835_02890 [Chloroflexota bacterium]
MDATLSAIILAVVSALLSGFATYTVARREAEIKLFSLIDESTAKDRLEAYKGLWKKMKLLSQYPPTPDVTYGSLKLLNEDFRDWYFNLGGVYLTTASKHRYLKAQETLYEVWKDHRENLTEMIQTPEYDQAREKLSDLRDQLAEDLRSRLPPGASAAEITTRFLRS